MKLKRLVKENFDVHSDGSIYNKRGVKIADNIQEFNRMESRIRYANIARSKYFKSQGIDNSSQAYGGKITALSQLGNAGELVVNAVKKASYERYNFRNYVEDRDREFKQRYIDALANSGLSPQEVLELTEHFDKMTPREFVEAHRNGDLADINMFDSDEQVLYIGDVATTELRNYLQDYREANK